MSLTDLSRKLLFNREEARKPADFGAPEKEIYKPETTAESVEKLAKKKEKKKTLEQDLKEIKIKPGAPAFKALADQTKDPLYQEVEDILEEDLEETYINLSPAKQNEFRLKGEETSARLTELLKKTKVKAKEILDLIKRWLLIIPGINRFFLEQEAKIKTDQILKLKKRTKNQDQNQV